MKQREWSAGHYTKLARTFERDIYPAIGKLPIASITPAIVAKAIEDIHKRNVLETATRILQHLNGIFRYTQAKGLCRDNPALPAREILPHKKDTGRMPALLSLLCWAIFCAVRIWREFHPQYAWRIAYALLPRRG